ncbi:hypothetical protein, partial [Rhizobium leguminosarum]|uniref:hypothetical protein n=1 Tax=Rhizobium leguminosarum TaxID=384 RepID=UPI003D03ADF7
VYIAVYIDRASTLSLTAQRGPTRMRTQGMRWIKQQAGVLGLALGTLLLQNFQLRKATNGANLR